MTRVKLTSVRAFPNVQPYKEQALKPLEEAAYMMVLATFSLLVAMDLEGGRYGR